MKFAFDLGNRVIVPNSNGVQGVITNVMAGIGMENQYIVLALTDDGKSGSVGYGEGILLASQPQTAAASTKAKR